jgi:branched-subunit amino acid transport protein AzlD
MLATVNDRWPRKLVQMLVQTLSAVLMLLLVCCLARNRMSLQSTTSRPAKLSSTEH